MTVLQTFPALAGLTWDITRAETFSSRVLTARSGLEYRAANWSSPRVKFSLKFSTLRTAAAYQEYQTLQAFLNNQAGMFSPFYYNDQSTPDNAVIKQPIGAGNGIQQIFPLVRSVGGYTAPVNYASNISAVYINNVLKNITTDWIPHQSGNYGTDSIQFITPVANGALVTASFNYNFVCRFLQDDPEFNNFISGRFEVKALDFYSVK